MRWAHVMAGAPQNPARPGAGLGAFPYLSGYGLMLRVSRLGALGPPELRELGVRAPATCDVLVETQQLRTTGRTFLRALKLHETPVATFWPPDRWSPAALDDTWRQTKRPLRQCPACARYGYHCAAFQIGSITHCPWHGDRLATACWKCGRPHSTGFNRQRRMGVCACGHDSFAIGVAGSRMWEFPTQTADAWLRKYFDWAAAERERRWLVLPAGAAAQDRALEALAPPPSFLQAAAPGSEVIEFVGAEEDPATDRFQGWCLLGGDRPLTFVALPAPLEAELAATTREVAVGLSPELPVPKELCYSHGFAENRSLEDNVVARADCFICPHQSGPAGGTWLNLSAVDPGMPGFAGRLLSAATAQLVQRGAAAPFQNRAPHVQQSADIDRIHGRRHLESALRVTLVRAYSQGLEALLRTMGKVPWPANRPWYVPAIELRREAARLQAVRLVWVAVTAPRVQRIVEIPLPPVRAAPKPSRRCARGRRKAGATSSAATGPATG